MIVVSVTNCPPKLCGDLSKWLLEIDTGVYVGQIGARVREALWERICENIGSGQAIMIFSSNNEQHFDFYLHNTSWKPIDYDGVKLLKHPCFNNKNAYLDNDDKMSNASIRRMNMKRRRKQMLNSYVLLDIETTGLECEKDEIIEIGVVEVSAGNIIKQCSWLINVENIPLEIENLTGITEQLIKTEGLNQKYVLERVIEILDDKDVLMYNAKFDLSFLNRAFQKEKLEMPDISVHDVMDMSKKLLNNIRDYKLETVAKHLEINTIQKHRAIDDCIMLNNVYVKLKEKC